MSQWPVDDGDDVDVVVAIGRDAVIECGVDARPVEAVSSAHLAQHHVSHCLHAHLQTTTLNTAPSQTAPLFVSVHTRKYMGQHGVRCW